MTDNYLGLHKVLNASSAFMSNFFPSSQGPSPHGHSSSMQFAPDRTQLSPPSHEGTSSQSLGNTNTPNIAQYHIQGPTLPPFQHRGGGGAFLSSPQHAFTPQQSHPTPQHDNETPTLPLIANPAPDYNHINEDFQSYDPAQKPEARNNKRSPKRPAAAESPDGKTPSSNGRRRARTKVVAWDPKDLEDIYERKEIKKEDWDAICRDYPSRTRVAMRQQVIKLRDKKQREATGQGYNTGRRSTYTASPQAASFSNDIRWATVNGSSPANLDPYHGRESFEDEDSSEEYDLSSAPDSDHDAKLNRHFDHPARSTPQQTQPPPHTEFHPNQSAPVPMPVIIQEAPPSGVQKPPHFDVVAAQSRGKPIAPRQPPVPPSMPIEIMDDMQPHPHPPPPPPPPPEPRATQRAKRGREIEAIGTPDSRSSSNFAKRRKPQAEPTGAPMAVGNVGEGHMAPFNPAVAYPMPPAPLRIPQESELDNLCIQFRDVFRLVKAGFEEDQRVRNEIYEAALGRANARVIQAQQHADDISEDFSVKLRELRVSTHLEFEHREQQYDALQAELLRSREEHARTRGENAQLRDETARKDEQIAALSEAVEHARESKAPEPVAKADTHMPRVEDSSSMEGAEQQILAAKQNAKRADAANDLLAEEITRLRSDRAEAQRRFHEVEVVHDGLTATLDEFVSKDPEEMTQKMIKKQVLGVKEADQQLANKFMEVKDLLKQLEHLPSNDVQPAANPSSIGPASHDHS